MTNLPEWIIGTVLEVEENPFAGKVVSARTDDGRIFFGHAELFSLCLPKLVRHRKGHAIESCVFRTHVVISCRAVLEIVVIRYGNDFRLGIKRYWKLDSGICRTRDGLADKMLIFRKRYRRQIFKSSPNWSTALCSVALRNAVLCAPTWRVRTLQFIFCRWNYFFFCSGR